MKNGKKIFAIIMAGGKGTRIGAIDKPKGMFEVAGRPLIDWAISPLEELKREGVVDRIITIVGFQGDKIVDYLGERSEFVWQDQQLGTAHAVRQAENLIALEDGLTIITNGDHPLYSKQTYLSALENSLSNDATVNFSVANDPERFNDYGRVIRDGSGKILRVVELKSATKEQEAIPERNINLYVIDNKWLFGALSRINMNPIKQEYYLTDIIEVASEEGAKIISTQIKDLEEAQGINTPEDLQMVEKVLLEKAGDR
ncbi:MAG: Bifunctional protein GlmU [bacterium ADurb.BinA186]|nr:MAG: Bifunctional protein GlmU [bacterium ADurb.BinA186]